jgi:hypothetical protein
MIDNFNIQGYNLIYLYNPIYRKNKLGTSLNKLASPKILSLFFPLWQCARGERLNKIM